MANLSASAILRGKLTLFIDQYGSRYYASTVRELKSRVGPGQVSRMFVTKKNGQTMHVGYVIGYRWLEAMLKRVRTYVSGYMAAFAAGMPAPGNGDCFYCRGMFGPDALKSPERLTEHMRERYYVPSLALAAVAAKGYLVPAVILGYNPDTGMIGGASRMAMPDSVKRALTKFLKSALLPDVAR